MAIAVAYANSFSGALVYDDRAAITENGSIRSFWPLSDLFSPPGESGTGGRPLANLTFALSYALSGLSPWGYHLINVAVHLLTALALFGVLRRTFLMPALRTRWSQDSLSLAAAVALVWAVHPLQVQVVTYLSQRTESLMALFYLLTLYCFIRGIERQSRLWHPLAVVSFLLGVLCKEIIATAPLLVLAYDRTLVAGSFKAALRARWRLYAALAACWVPLAFLLVGVKTRGVGYGLGVPWLEYAFTECKAILLYVKLSVWPHPLIFDRGTELVTSPVVAVPFILGLIGLLAVTAWAFWRRPILGLAGVFFLLILAPASSVIPVIQQPIAENRPYLPSAAVVTLVVTGLYLRTSRPTTLALCGGVAIAGIWGTAQRNRDFATEEAIWVDTVAKCPQNPRAHYNLGVVLDHLGRVSEAVVQYQAALAIDPNYVGALNNLGNALAEHGKVTEAFPFLEKAVHLQPSNVDAQYNLGNAFMNTGRLPEAIEKYQTVLRLDPKHTKSHNNLGFVYLKNGRLLDAVREFEASIALDPLFADPHSNIAVALADLNRLPEAIAHSETALRLNPNHASARQNLEILRARERELRIKR